MDTQPATQNPDSLEDTQMQIETSLQALEAIGEKVNDDTTLKLMIMSKFPPNVIDSLEEKAELINHGVFDMAFLRDELCKYAERKKRMLS